MKFRGEYPEDWPLISWVVKLRALFECERCHEPDNAATGHALTVHHLDNDKANCEWWNLAALCQRCHLKIQGRVNMAQFWMFEHSDWMVPHVLGFYRKEQEMVTESDEPTEIEPVPEGMSITVPEGHVLIKVGMDQTELHLRQEVNLVLNYAKQQKIVTEDDAKHIADDLISIATLRKQVKDKQAEYLRPIRARVDDIMTRFKMIGGPLDEAEGIFRQLIKGWQDACADKIRQAKELEDLKARVQVKEAELAGKPAPVIAPSDTMLQPDQHKIRGLAGDIGSMEVKKWRITDFAKIPDRFKTLDTMAINRLVKGGGTCDGIEVYVEHVPRIIGRR